MSRAVGRGVLNVTKIHKTLRTMLHTFCAKVCVCVCTKGTSQTVSSTAECCKRASQSCRSAELCANVHSPVQSNSLFLLLLFFLGVVKPTPLQPPQGGAYCDGRECQLPADRGFTSFLSLSHLLQKRNYIEWT